MVWNILDLCSIWVVLHSAGSAWCNYSFALWYLVNVRNVLAQMIFPLMSSNLSPPWRHCRPCIGAGGPKCMLWDELQRGRRRYVQRDATSALGDGIPGLIKETWLEELPERPQYIVNHGQTQKTFLAFPSYDHVKHIHSGTWDASTEPGASRMEEACSNYRRTLASAKLKQNDQLC